MAWSSSGRRLIVSLGPKLCRDSSLGEPRSFNRASCGWRPFLSSAIGLTPDRAPTTKRIFYTVYLGSFILFLLKLYLLVAAVSSLPQKETSHDCSRQDRGFDTAALEGGGAVAPGRRVGGPRVRCCTRSCSCPCGWLVRSGGERRGGARWRRGGPRRGLGGHMGGGIGSDFVAGGGFGGSRVGGFGEVPGGVREWPGRWV